LDRILSEGYIHGWGNDKQLINPALSFSTLESFNPALDRKEVQVFLLNIPGKEKYQKPWITNDPSSVPFFNKQNEQNTLFYYMQHDDSLQGYLRKFRKFDFDFE
jgi:hypothetical protein